MDEVTISETVEKTQKKDFVLERQTTSILWNDFVHRKAVVDGQPNSCISFNNMPILMIGCYQRVSLQPFIGDTKYFCNIRKTESGLF